MPDSTSRCVFVILTTSFTFLQFICIVDTFVAQLYVLIDHDNPNCGFCLNCDQCHVTVFEFVKIITVLDLFLALATGISVWLHNVNLVRAIKRKDISLCRKYAETFWYFIILFLTYFAFSAPVRSGWLMIEFQMDQNDDLCESHIVMLALAGFQFLFALTTYFCVLYYFWNLKTVDNLEPPPLFTIQNGMKQNELL